MNRLAIIMILILILVGIIFVSARYVSRLESNLKQSQETVKQLESSIEVQKQTIIFLQKDFEAISFIHQEMQKRLQNQNQELRKLNNKFTQNSAGEPRNFGKLAREKPQLIETIVNRGTAQARRCLELASGDKLTEQEKNDATQVKILASCTD